MGDPKSIELFHKASTLLEQGTAEQTFSKRTSLLIKASGLFEGASRCDPRYQAALIAQHKEMIHQTLSGPRDGDGGDRTRSAAPRAGPDRSGQDRADRCARHGAQHGNAAEQHFLRGLCAQRTNAHKDAVKEFSAALDKQSGYAEALFSRGCSYRTLNGTSKQRPAKLHKALADIQNAAAAGHAEAAAQVVPLTQEVAAEENYLSALAALDQTDLRTAEQLCQQATAAYPGHTEASALLTRIMRLDVPGFSAVPHTGGGPRCSIITVYLNERWIPVRGYSSKNLLPNDRFTFSFEDGSGNLPGPVKGTKQGAPTFTPTEDAVPLPSGWAWSAGGGWETSICDAEFDEEGYQVSVVN